MCRDAVETIINLEHLGLPFNRTPEGKIDQRRFGGHTRNYGEAPGPPLVLRRRPHRPRDPADALPAVHQARGRRSSTSTRSSTCCRGRGRCSGVIALQLPTGELHVFRAKAVLFATGGFGTMFKVTSNAHTLTGDGVAIAVPPRAAAGGHGVLPVPPDRDLRLGILLSEAVRGEGGILRQQRGRALHGALRADHEGPRPARRGQPRASTRRSPRGGGSTARTTSISTFATSAPKVIDKKLPDMTDFIRDLLRHRARSRAGADPADRPLRDGRHPDRHRRRVSCLDEQRHASCPASTRRASAPASASTARTGWAPTRCWTSSSSAGGPGSPWPRTLGERRRRRRLPTERRSNRAQARSTDCCAAPRASAPAVHPRRAAGGDVRPSAASIGPASCSRSAGHEVAAEGARAAPPRRGQGLPLQHRPRSRRWSSASCSTAPRRPSRRRSARTESRGGHCARGLSRARRRRLAEAHAGRPRPDGGSAAGATSRSPSRSSSPRRGRTEADRRRSSARSGASIRRPTRSRTGRSTASTPSRRIACSTCCTRSSGTRTARSPSAAPARTASAAPTRCCINGRNRLACEYLVKDAGQQDQRRGDAGLPLVKDLLVDMDGFLEKYKQVMPFLVNDERGPPTAGSAASRRRSATRYDDTTKCILCAACTTACPVVLDAIPITSARPPSSTPIASSSTPATSAPRSGSRSWPTPTASGAAAPSSTASRPARAASTSPAPSSRWSARSSDSEPGGGSTPPPGRLVIYTDGAARGNPGPAGAGAVLRDAPGGRLGEIAASSASAPTTTRSGPRSSWPLRRRCAWAPRTSTCAWTHSWWRARSAAGIASSIRT